jgi:putative ATP-dependent endonuclease of the OLD family
VTQVLIGANNAGKTSFLDALFAAIGVARKSVTTDDVRLGAGESVPPITREVIIDVMVRRPSSEY